MILDDILFIYGAPRSGTTFLNAIIREHFDYGLCAEANFILTFKKRLLFYGDLNRDKPLKRLICDICNDEMLQHFRTTYSKYAGRPVDVQPADVLKNLPERTYPGVIYAVLSCVAQQLGRSRNGNKNPDFYRCLPQLNRWFPNAKFLRIVRDGRDVALSTMKESWGEQSVYACARKWVQVEKKATAFEATISTDRYLTLQYEKLLTSPAQTHDQLAMFLCQVTDGPTKDRFVTSVESEGKVNNYEKWKRYMSRENLEVYEAVAGDCLQRYGYERVFESPRLSYVRRHYYASQELKRRLLVRFSRKYSKQ